MERGAQMGRGAQAKGARSVAIKRRISLRNREESVRRWAAEGKGDAWIANALGTSAGSIQSFRSRRRITLDPRGSRPRGVLPHGWAGPSYEGVIEQPSSGGADNCAVGLWFEPAVADDPVYGRRWRSRGPVEIRLTRGAIMLRPKG